MEWRDIGSHLRRQHGDARIKVELKPPDWWIRADLPFNKRLYTKGVRVRIKAIKEEGSARFLHGLTGTVIRPHDSGMGWVWIELDSNDRTAQRLWPIAVDRLEEISS